MSSTEDHQRVNNSVYIRCVYVRWNEATCTNVFVTILFREVESSDFRLQLCDVIQIYAISAQVLAPLL